MISLFLVRKKVTVVTWVFGRSVWEECGGGRDGGREGGTEGGMEGRTNVSDHGVPIITP